MSTISEPLSPREPIRTREVGWSVIALYIGVETALVLLLLRFRRTGPLGQFFAGPGWRENLVFFATLLLVAVAGVMFGLGRLRPADVGVRRDKLKEGVLVIGAAWLLIQVLAAMSALLTSAPLLVARTWTRMGVGGTLLWAAVMFAGTALYEEIAFRGFLFPQFYLKLRGSHRVRFWGALLASQFLFAIGHAPAHIVIRHLSGAALWTQVVLQGFAGVMLLLLYLRTRNLWIVIGVHGLADAATPIFRGALTWEYLLIALLVAWPWLVRRPTQRGLAVVERLPDEVRGERTVGELEAQRPAAVQSASPGG